MERAWNADELQAKGIEVIDINLEKDVLPFADESVDLIIANQVMEHCKEIFWINSEIFRCLRPGGHLFLGVPNVLSLHNRLLGMFGFHPTQHKSLSAHVRPFSKRDIIQFYTQINTTFYGQTMYSFFQDMSPVCFCMVNYCQSTC
ncbi:hypothetical protein EZS27_007641 [termite gut metagenome]|uniref:Methyltransferase type 11 domain-containing protein n=1 Tax=termite gut metagenome TaxID=433724 RepID=A0A5J4SHI6_9ZZZZ